MQLFDPADIRPYEGWDTQKDGFFFTFDGILVDDFRSEKDHGWVPRSDATGLLYGGQLQPGDRDEHDGHRALPGEAKRRRPD